ncbi:MAG: serine/threonine protein kinase [Acidobacteria bacterium]|nr:serine/threonine protein kinase [Acidobacteriota bacterium]
MAIQISHYKLLRKLGAGGMGDVYLAQDTILNRYVAIKILPKKFTSNPERLGRFQREAQVASILNHPNVLTIHEVGEHDGFHYIVTEYVDGETLSDVLRGGSLPVAEAIRIAIGVAEALAAAHEFWIVHRDIKPDNIMLRHDHYVKVLDFGLAKLTDPEGATVHFETQPGTLPGSVRYVAPERLLGEVADPRADIFSLGIVTYEMLAGETPFPGNGVLDIVQAILKSEPPPLRSRRPEVPETLELIVMKALQKDPATRYQTAKELLTDLVDLRQILEYENTARRLRERLMPRVPET